MPEAFVPEEANENELDVGVDFDTIEIPEFDLDTDIEAALDEESTGEVADMEYST